jgi:hypothetical protein
MATRIRDYFHVLAAILFFAALANFLVFFAVAIYIGGDAWNGKVEEGRYYVASHGKYTEVSSEVWHYSHAHVISVLITHPVGILAVGVSHALDR